MSDQATQGHVRAVAFAGSSDIERDDGTPLAIGLLPADARRLAACWNACDGISTEELEGAVQIGQPLLPVMTGLIEERTKALGQLAEVRAELGAARTREAQLVEALDDIKDMNDLELIDIARVIAAEAIAAVDIIVQPTPDQVRAAADHTVRLAARANHVITIEQIPRLPLAMGNYDTVVSVRPARGSAS